MAKVTIEGVIKSDVCGRGERHTVELTPRLQALVANRIIKVIDSHPETEPAVEPAAAEPPRKRRRRAASE